jgi:hypothetical protein
MPETQKLDFIREIGFTHMRISGESDVSLSLSLSLSLSPTSLTIAHTLCMPSMSLCAHLISVILLTSLHPYPPSLHLSLLPLLSTPLLSTALSSSPLLFSPLRGPQHSASANGMHVQTLRYTAQDESTHTPSDSHLEVILAPLSLPLSCSYLCLCLCLCLCHLIVAVDMLSETFDDIEDRVRVKVTVGVRVRPEHQSLSLLPSSLPPYLPSLYSRMTVMWIALMCPRRSNRSIVSHKWQHSSRVVEIRLTALNSEL